MKALVGAFNQEKALVGICKTVRNLREGSFEALECSSVAVSTNND